jgi:NAD-dependent SIR2 family protein deacetylase
MHQDETNSAFQRAASWLSSADGLLITAGAGMGVDSGLPDFRGQNGFWKAYPALARAGLSFSSIACPDAFKRNPRQAWGFYGHRLALYRETVPHAGFEILRQWSERFTHGAFVVTSNVDGQFQKAGFGSKRIHEIHGSIHQLQCLHSCQGTTWPADSFIPDVDHANCLLLNDIPLCQECGSIARPRILMFGDWEWVSGQTQIQQALFREWRSRIANLVIVEIGAGTDIESIRLVSQRQGPTAKLIRINPREPQIPLQLDGISLAMGGLSALRGIDSELNKPELNFTD